MKKLVERIHRMLAADFSLGNRTTATEHAVVVSNPEFPLVPEANLVHSVRLAPGGKVGALLEEVDTLLAAAGTPWRHVVVDPFSRPEALGDLLAEKGFHARLRVGAAYVATPTADPHPGVAVRGIAEKSRWAQCSGLRRRIEAAGGRSGEELEQYAALARRRSLSSNVRFYLALEDFNPVGHVGLLSVGRTGMIVDLAVAPERRGSGIAQAMVGKMVERSRNLGHDLTCIVHDDVPGAADPLAGMGFEPSARFVSYVLRRPASRQRA